jgi:hypothetical protein
MACGGEGPHEEWQTQGVSRVQPRGPQKKAEARRRLKVSETTGANDDEANERTNEERARDATT